MATGETRHIKGWRSQMEETATELRKRVWQAPAMTVYHDGQVSRNSDDLVGHTPWFHREFGAERAIASADLKRFRSARMRIARSEWTSEYRSAINAYTRAWRAKQPDEWRQAEAAKKRARRAAKPDLYKAIGKRQEERRRDNRNAQRREAYAQAPELHRAQCNARRAANREHSRAVARAAYARKKASKPPSA